MLNAYVEQISFATATLEQLLTKPETFPRMGQFPVLQSRYTDGKVTDGYINTLIEYLPGGVLIRFERMRDGVTFAGFYRLDAHRNGVMFTADPSTAPQLPEKPRYVFTDIDLTTLDEAALVDLFKRTNESATAENATDISNFYEHALETLGLDTTMNPFREFLTNIGTLATHMEGFAAQENTRRKAFRAATKYGVLMTARGIR